jgi:hypothetical protein
VNLHSDYERRLGLSCYYPEDIDYEFRGYLLERLYDGEKQAQIV